jgi:hypothetical protein
MDSLPSPILKPPHLIIRTFLKEEYAEVKARLMYLETVECRKVMSKIQIDEARKLATQQFKLILTGLCRS